MGYKGLKRYNDRQKTMYILILKRHNIDKRQIDRKIVREKDNKRQIFRYKTKHSLIDRRHDIDHLNIMKQPRSKETKTCHG